MNRISAGNLVKIAHALKLRVTELLPEGEGNSSDPPLPTDVLSRSRDGVALVRAFNCIKSRLNSADSKSSSLDFVYTSLPENVEFYASPESEPIPPAISSRDVGSTLHGVVFDIPVGAASE